MNKFEYQLYSRPVCNGSDQRHLFQDHNRRDKINCSGIYVQCQRCSLVYLRERPNWEEIVRFYSALDSGITANAGRIDAATLRKQIEQPIPKWKSLLRKVRFRPHSWPLESVPRRSKRLLDLGCGNGTKLYEFAERGYDIWGVDVGVDTIKVCQNLLPQGHFIQGELQNTNLPTDFFDYIRIDNALEHVPNPTEVVEKCHRLLRKRGQLLIYVPHGRSLSMRIMKGGSISSWIPFHLSLFTRNSLKWLTEDAGFKDIHIYGYYPTSWLPLSFVQWKNKKQLASGFDYPFWLDFVGYPVGWLAAKLGLAEELVGTGIKS